MSNLPGPNISSTLNETSKQDQQNILSISSLVCLIIFNILFSILGTSGNTLVLLAVIKNSFLQTVPDLFIFSLATADLLVTCVQEPMLTYRIYRINNPWSVFNSILESIGFLSLLASITSMFVVTIDRFIAIQRPFLYVRLATKKRAAGVISALWTLSVALATINHFIDGSVKYFIMWAYVFILLTLTVLMYVYIFAEAKKQQHKMTTVITPEAIESPECNSQGQRNVPLPERKKRERKPAKTIAIVVGVFIVFWTPFLIFVISNTDIIQTQEIGIMIVFYWMLSLSLWNSSINPYIYCMRNSRYRNAFAKLLHLERRVHFDSTSQAPASTLRPQNAHVTSLAVKEKEMVAIHT